MKRLLPVLAISALGSLACEPASPGLAINVDVSPIWGDQITRVQLSDMLAGALSGGPVVASCGDVAAEQNNAEDWQAVQDCDTFMGTVPPGAVCPQEQRELTSDPGAAGLTWQLGSGPHTLTAVGFDASGALLTHDCQTVEVREGEYVDVTFRL